MTSDRGQPTAIASSRDLITAHDAEPDLSGPMQLYDATPIIGESTRSAVRDAEAWLADRMEGE